MTAAAAKAYIGIGANLGDARASVEQSIVLLAALPFTRLLARSSLYRSAPVEASGDDYVNAVVQLQTALAPEDLLAQLMQLERRFGRERPWRNAPRTLDLDILLYNDLVLRTDTLVLPHPRMHQRAFVLLPLAEIAPGLQIPGMGPIAQLLGATADQQIERIAGS